MKTAMTVPQLAEAVIDLASRKADLLIPPTDMCFRLDGDQLTLTSPDLSRATLTARAYSQTCEHFGVPKRYADMLRARGRPRLLPLARRPLRRDPDGLVGADKPAWITHPGLPADNPRGHPFTNHPSTTRKWNTSAHPRRHGVIVRERVRRLPPRETRHHGRRDRYRHPLDRDSRLGGLYVGVVIRNGEVGANIVGPMLYRLGNAWAKNSSATGTGSPRKSMDSARADGPTYSEQAQRDGRRRSWRRKASGGRRVGPSAARWRAVLLEAVEDPR